MEEMLLCFFLLTINFFVQSTCEMTFTFGRYPDVQLHLHRAVVEEQKVVMWLMLIKPEVKSVSSYTSPAQLSSPVQSYNYHDKVLCSVEQRAGQRLPGCLLQKQEVLQLQVELFLSYQKHVENSFHTQLLGLVN